MNLDTQEGDLGEKALEVDGFRKETLLLRREGGGVEAVGSTSSPQDLREFWFPRGAPRLRRAGWPRVVCRRWGPRAAVKVRR